jgi:aminoglycoside phosphotransferase (APT) family kinase protein
MSATIEDSAVESLLNKIEPGSRLLRSWPLLGGISAQVTALEIARPDGSSRKLVLRQYGDYRLRSHPQIAGQEFSILQQLGPQGLPVPEACLLDESGEIFPAPYIVTGFVDGEADFAPADLKHTIEHLAAMLVRIHRADHAMPKLVTPTGKGYRAAEATLDETLQEGRIRAALDSLWPLSHGNPACLLHGDYWPGNVLWQDGQIAAVIDWEDAEIGDPLADLGNSRMEFNWAYGMAAMQTFTAAYLALNPIDTTDLPYWDLAAAIRPTHRLAGWATSPEELVEMREGHRLFVEQAFAALSS